MSLELAHMCIIFMCASCFINFLTPTAKPLNPLRYSVTKCQSTTFFHRVKKLFIARQRESIFMTKCTLLTLFINLYFCVETAYGKCIKFMALLINHQRCFSGEGAKKPSVGLKGKVFSYKIMESRRRNVV